MLRKVLRSIAAVATAALLAACALSEDKVPVDYVPDPAPRAALPAAQGVTVSVSAADRRSQYADRIGTKKNGYGMEMARIVATNDVIALVRSAFEQEFKAQGFQIGSGGAAVTIEVQNFYNNFRLGLVAGTGVAEVSFSVKVRDASGTLLYQQFYDGTGTVDGVMLASGTNAKLGVEKALAAAVKLAFADAELQKALLSTRPQPSAASGRRV
jgi:uncharacterized lipoprotein YajG